MIDLKKGDIVKVHLWHGVVVNLYQSEGCDEIIEVWFVKNVFKMQRTEFLPLPAEGLEPATMEGLQKEINDLMVGLHHNLEKLLATRSR